MWCSRRKGAERPQLIENKQKWPNLQEFLAHAWRVEEHGAENEGADGNQNSGRDEKDIERQRGFRQRRNEIFNLGEFASAPT